MKTTNVRSKSEEEIGGIVPMNTPSCRRPSALMCAFFFASTVSIFAQGSLTPPGPPAPTMKTLQQVQPRTDVATLSGDSSDQFVINQPGSYYLTGNINGVSGKNGIIVLSDNVTIDLNGFAMVGVSGAQTGIYISSPHSGIRIFNGAIRNWNAGGIYALQATESMFERIQVINNIGNANITTGANCEVIECVARGGGAGGISSGDGCVIERCILQNNANLSLSTGDNCTIVGCTAQQNLVNGINSGAGCAITGCTAKANQGVGISTGNSCMVKGCASFGNNAPGLTSAHGIQTGQGSTITECAVQSNNGIGINVAGGCVISDCSVLLSQTHNIVTLDGCTIRHSVASSSTAGFGIDTATSCTIIGCTVQANSSGDGIVTGDHCTVKDCTLSMNQGAGAIHTGMDSTISGCTVQNNQDVGILVSDGSSVTACTANGNQSEGIKVTTKCVVANNSADGNGQGGIHATGGGNRIESNVVRNNTLFGITVDTSNAGNLIVRNSAGNNTSGPYSNVAGNNDYGPVSSNPSAATNPFTNFQ